MKNSLISGCVDIWLDEIVPCHKDTETGEIKEIQGLVGVKNDTEVNAAYLHWACSAPQNNKHAFGSQKYSGVGAQYPYQFILEGDASRKLLEVYTYEWN